MLRRECAVTLNCNFDTALTQNYHSQSQIIRILTESWVSENMYCPHCGHNALNHFPNNKAVCGRFLLPHL